MCLLRLLLWTLPERIDRTPDRLVIASSTHNVIILLTEVKKKEKNDFL